MRFGPMRKKKVPEGWESLNQPVGLQCSECGHMNPYTMGMMIKKPEDTKIVMFVDGIQLNKISWKEFIMAKLRKFYYGEFNWGKRIKK